MDEMADTCEGVGMRAREQNTFSVIKSHGIARLGRFEWLFATILHLESCRLGGMLSPLL